MPVDRVPGAKRRMMTRIRRDTLGLRRNANPNLYASSVPTSASSAMESSIMSTADALATAGEMVVVEDVSASIEHHHHSVSTVPLMNGITVTLTNGTVTVDGEDGDNNKYDVADKDENDLPAIDFASATNHNNMETQTTPSREELHEPEHVGASVVDESTSVDKLHMMQTDDDPLLQETINAIMNGAEGIEVVNTSEHDHVETGTVPSDPSIASVMAATRSTNDEVETDRNYECTYCGKLFTRSNTLSYHLKVHTGERPFKCKHCAKAFREQYRLMKHLKTHSKYRNRRLERGCNIVEQADSRVMMAPSVRVHLHRGASAALLAGANGLVTTGEEDYTTGDSERFFKSYDLPDGSVAMKLEPDISLTEDADVSDVGPDAMLTTEEVETAEDHQPLIEEQEDPNGVQDGTGSGDGNEIRYQIIEERIKSLQREVHLVNQNLNRVETKHPHHVSTSTTSPSIQPKTIFLTSTTATPQNPTGAQVQVQPVSVFHTSSSPIAHQHPVSRVGTHAKEARTTTNTHYYQFAEPSTVVHVKPEASPPPTAQKVCSPSPTPPPQQQPPPASQAPTQALTLGSSVNGGNQLLDTFPEIPELPIRTVSDFLDLNDHCTDNEQFLLQMMIRLHQEIHNSQPFQRNIKRMMEALVTYEVLCQFSWSGKSAINGQYTKYVFGNSLGIIDLLTKTLNLGKSAQEAEANQKPIFAAIQSFIKHSRQNMIRDSRKRRDPIRGSVGGGMAVTGEVIAGMVPDTTTATTTTTIAYHVNGGERLQIKQLRSERHHHQQTELVNPF
uniref:C2H2-type domain-containing protein n=1 Tax=Anopheles culicifacies TaxID=139723 RepID=A0A182LUX1_9DIPT